MNLISQIISHVRSNLLRSIISLIFLLCLMGAYLFTVIEISQNPDLNTFGEAFWWVVVTITTVGYGDVVPVTPFGRILAVLIIFTGVALFSMFTAIISSIFVTQKLKEERGLKQISERNHIILCGWNHTAEQILNILFQKNRNSSVVLINQLPEDQIQNILLNYKEHSLQFIRGDFAQEEILSRANITKAKTVIIIPDASAGITARSDEKTILTAFSVKAIHPKIKVYAHIIDHDNEPYLKKAQVEDYIVSDALSGVMLGEMVVSPGVPQSILQLIQGGESGNLIRQAVPSSLIGKSFGEALNFYRENQELPIAIVKEHKTLSLTQILSEDYSDLDRFIEKKFQEAGRTLKKGGYVDVRLNPPDDFILEKDFSLIVIKSG